MKADLKQQVPGSGYQAPSCLISKARTVAPWRCEAGLFGRWRSRDGCLAAFSCCISCCGRCCICWRAVAAAADISKFVDRGVTTQHDTVGRFTASTSQYKRLNTSFHQRVKPLSMSTTTDKSPVEQFSAIQKCTAVVEDTARSRTVFPLISYIALTFSILFSVRYSWCLWACYATTA